MSLSHLILPGIPLWPGDPEVQVVDVATQEREGYALRRLTLGEHSGTHLVAPASFYRSGKGVEVFAEEPVVAPAIVIDVAPEAEADPDLLLGLEQVRAWERSHGQIPRGAVVLLHTGWDKRWQDPAAFLNRDVSGAMHFPGFGLEAVGYLMEERGVRGIGVDTHGVDGGLDSRFQVSRLVLSATRVVLENLCRLSELPSRGALLVVGVLGLKGGSGSPAAVIALLP